MEKEHDEAFASRIRYTLFWTHTLCAPR